VRNAGAPSSSSSHVDRLGFSRRLVKDALRNTLLSVDLRLLAWPLPAPWPSGSPRPSSGGTSLSRRFLPWAAASSRCQCGTGMPGKAANKSPSQAFQTIKSINAVCARAGLGVADFLS
jgi:hypothetical protein